MVTCAFLLTLRPSFTHAPGELCDTLLIKYLVCLEHPESVKTVQIYVDTCLSVQNVDGYSSSRQGASFQLGISVIFQMVKKCVELQHNEELKIVYVHVTYFLIYLLLMSKRYQIIM